MMRFNGIECAERVTNIWLDVNGKYFVSKNAKCTYDRPYKTLRRRRPHNLAYYRSAAISGCICCPNNGIGCCHRTCLWNGKCGKIHFVRKLARFILLTNRKQIGNELDENDSIWLENSYFHIFIERTKIEFFPLKLVLIYISPIKCSSRCHIRVFGSFALFCQWSNYCARGQRHVHGNIQNSIDMRYAKAINQTNNNNNIADSVPSETENGTNCAGKVLPKNHPCQMASAVAQQSITDGSAHAFRRWRLKWSGEQVS